MQDLRKRSELFARDEGNWGLTATVLTSAERHVMPITTFSRDRKLEVESCSGINDEERHKKHKTTTTQEQQRRRRNKPEQVNGECDGRGRWAHRLPGCSSTAKTSATKRQERRMKSEDRRHSTTNHSLRRRSSAPDGAAAEADAAVEATKIQALQITTMTMMMMTHDAFTTLTSTINTSL